jgi:hypothetical protein
MKSSLRVISCLAIFAFTTPCFVSADDKAATPAASPAAPAKAKSKYTPLYAQVDSITDTLLTVKGTGPDLKFVINADTKITKDKAHKEAAKPSDVTAGQ